MIQCVAAKMGTFTVEDLRKATGIFLTLNPPGIIPLTNPQSLLTLVRLNAERVRTNAASHGPRDARAAPARCGEGLFGGLVWWYGNSFGRGVGWKRLVIK